MWLASSGWVCGWCRWVLPGEDSLRGWPLRSNCRCGSLICEHGSILNQSKSSWSMLCFRMLCNFYTCMWVLVKSSSTWIMSYIINIITHLLIRFATHTLKYLLSAVFFVYEDVAGYIFGPFLFAKFVTGITLSIKL